MKTAGPDERQLVLLLRGINLAGRHRVPMADLRNLLTEMGYADVRTHLQSGNVVLRSAMDPESVREDVERRLNSRFEFEVPVIVRTAEELRAVVAHDPLGEVATDPTRYVVTFLSNPPDSSTVGSLSEKDFGDERFVVSDREVYQWCPGGQQDSPLLKALGKAGVTTSGTARNWRTVTRLAELAAE